MINYTWQENGQLLTRTTKGNKLAGDVNNSGTVDLVTTGLNPPSINSAADVNKDGQIGMPEVIYFLNKVSKQ